MNIVENFDLFAPRLINKKELLSPVTAPVQGVPKFWP